MGNASGLGDALSDPSTEPLAFRSARRPPRRSPLLAGRPVPPFNKEMSGPSTQSSRSSTLCLCLSPLSWLLSNQSINQSSKQVTFKHWVDECNQQSFFSKLRLSTAVLPYRK